MEPTQEELKKKKINLSKLTKNPNQIALAILASLTVFSYFIFVSYKPNISVAQETQENQEEEVKGTKSEKIVLPILFNAELISQDTIANVENITLQTRNTPEEVVQFYDLALDKRGWEIDAVGTSGTFVSKKYKKGKDKINISTSRQLTPQNGELTIVSIEVINN